MTTIQPSQFEVSLPFPLIAPTERSATSPASIAVEPEKSLWRMARAESHPVGTLLVDIGMFVSAGGVLVIAIMQMFRIL